MRDTTGTASANAQLRKSSHTGEALQPPQLVAVYPTAAIVQWQPPASSYQSQSGAAVPRERSPSWWQYTVEWSCSCTAHTGQPNVLATTDHWLLVPRQHPHDDLHIRVVAREEGDRRARPYTIPTRVSASHITLTSAMLEHPSWKARLPWLHPDALSHGSLFDALLLSLHTTRALAAMPPRRREQIALAVKGLQMMHDNPFSVITAMYDPIEAPFETARVHYYVACTIPTRRDVEQVSLAELVATVESGATLVFCGFASHAVSAVAAARAALAELARVSRTHLCGRVLCMCYGAPHALSCSTPLSTAQHAGHFLFYDVPDFPDSTPPTLTDATPPPASTAGLAPSSTCLATQLAEKVTFACGVRAHLPHYTSPTSSRHGDGHVCGVHATAPCLLSAVKTPGRAASPPSQSAGLAELVRLLAVVFPRTPQLLAPSISSAQADVHDEDATVVIVVRGHNLHYSPFMCATVLSHGTVFPLQTVNEAPHMLIGHGSLMGCLCAVHEAECEAGVPRRAARALALRITVSTAVGASSFPLSTTHPMTGLTAELTLRVPPSVARLAWLGSMASAPRPYRRLAVRAAQWLVATPALFLSHTVRLQPLQYTSSAALGTAHRTTVGLCHLSACAELCRHYINKASSNALVSFFSNMASRVGPPTKERRRAEMEPLTLEVPNAMESTYFMTSLGHGVSATQRDVCHYQDRSRSWLARISATLAWFSEAELYECKLLALRHIFKPCCEAACAGQPWSAEDRWESLPLVALEQRLYADIVFQVRDACANGASHGAQGLITEVMSFESFYTAVHGILLAAVPATHLVNDQLAAELVLEALCAWSFCLLYEMRCDAALCWTVVIVGDGAGATAVAAALAREWEELEKAEEEHVTIFGTSAQRDQENRPRLCLKCVPCKDVTVLSDVLSHNVLTSLYVVGEAHAYQDGTITSLLRSLDASAGTRKGRMRRDQWHCLLIKADEVLMHAHSSTNRLNTHPHRGSLSSPAASECIADWKATVTRDLSTLAAQYPESPDVIAVEPLRMAAIESYVNVFGSETDTTQAVEVVAASLSQHSQHVLKKLLLQDRIESEA